MAVAERGCKERDTIFGWFQSVVLNYQKLKNVRLERFIWAQWLSYIAAGVFAITSITYAPEVMSGKSRCRVFSSFANLEGEKRENETHQSFKVPQEKSHKWQQFLVFKHDKYLYFFKYTCTADKGMKQLTLEWESSFSHQYTSSLCLFSLKQATQKVSGKYHTTRVIILHYTKQCFHLNTYRLILVCTN